MRFHNQNDDDIKILASDMKTCTFINSYIMFSDSDENNDSPPYNRSSLNHEGNSDSNQDDFYEDVDVDPPRLRLKGDTTLNRPSSPPMQYSSHFTSLIDNEHDNNGYGDIHNEEFSNELASLFSLISNFTPEAVDITVHWKPFIPELIPAIGAIDAFIKVPRPDGEMDDLGLTILDEPSISQSNPQLLKMELREQYGITSPENQSDGYVGYIQNVQNNRKELDAWLESIEEIHRNRPPPVYIYQTQMPEIEYLMEQWDDTFDETLKSCPIPTADLDISLEEYAKIICAILEIPVKGNIIESLHHLFVLYSEFISNQYFKSQEE